MKDKDIMYGYNIGVWLTALNRLSLYVDEWM